MSITSSKTRASPCTSYKQEHPPSPVFSVMDQPASLDHMPDLVDEATLPWSPPRPYRMQGKLSHLPSPTKIHHLDELDLLLCHQDFPKLLELANQVQTKQHCAKTIFPISNGDSRKRQVLQVVAQMQERWISSQDSTSFEPSTPKRPKTLPATREIKIKLPKILRGMYPTTDSLLDDAMAILQDELAEATCESKQTFSKEAESSSGGAIAVKYSKWQTDILMNWMIIHKDQPFPNQDDVNQLMLAADLTQSQVINWTTNVRKRNRKATCEGGKKPHHFIDFLFLAHARDEAAEGADLPTTNNVPSTPQPMRQTSMMSPRKTRSTTRRKRKAIVLADEATPNETPSSTSPMSALTPRPPRTPSNRSSNMPFPSTPAFTATGYAQSPFPTTQAAPSTGETPYHHPLTPAGYYTTPHGGAASGSPYPHQYAGYGTSSSPYGYPMHHHYGYHPGHHPYYYNWDTPHPPTPDRRPRESSLRPIHEDQPTVNQESSPVPIKQEPVTKNEDPFSPISYDLTHLDDDVDNSLLEAFADYWEGHHDHHHQEPTPDPAPSSSACATHRLFEDSPMTYDMNKQDGVSYKVTQSLLYGVQSRLFIPNAVTATSSSASSADHDDNHSDLLPRAELDMEYVFHRKSFDDAEDMVADMDFLDISGEFDSVVAI